MSKFTSSPARMTTTKFVVKPDQNNMPKTDATIAPVHAPVPGNGTTTNNISLSHFPQHRSLNNNKQHQPKPLKFLNIALW